MKKLEAKSMNWNLAIILFNLKKKNLNVLKILETKIFIYRLLISLIKKFLISLKIEKLKISQFSKKSLF